MKKKRPTYIDGTDRKSKTDFTFFFTLFSFQMEKKVFPFVHSFIWRKLWKQAKHFTLSVIGADTTGKTSPVPAINILIIHGHMNIFIIH